MDRLIHENHTSAHKSGVLRLHHLAWNQLLTTANSTTVYCLCQYGPKYVVCEACARRIFLIKPSRACKCQYKFDNDGNPLYPCEKCMNNSDFILTDKSNKSCME